MKINILSTSHLSDLVENLHFSLAFRFQGNTKSEVVSYDDLCWLEMRSSVKFCCSRLGICRILKSNTVLAGFFPRKKNANRILFCKYNNTL